MVILTQVYNEQIGVPLDEFMKQNDKLIHVVANRFRKKLDATQEYGDLYQLASIGFIKAYQTFNPKQFNTKFSTYAIPKMTGEIQRYYRDQHNAIKFPRVFYDVWARVRMYDLSEEPVEVIAEKTGIELRFVKRAMQYFNKHRAVSIEEKYFGNGEDDDLKIKDTLGSDHDYTEIYVNEFMESLPKRLQTVLSLKLKGLTQNEIGQIMGISQSQVHRLLKKVGNHLLEYMDIAV